MSETTRPHRSGWCSGPEGARPQCERCKWPTCEHSCHAGSSHAAGGGDRYNRSTASTEGGPGTTAIARGQTESLTGVTGMSKCATSTATLTTGGDA